MSKLYEDIVQQFGIDADFLTGDTYIDSGQAEQNINGNGTLTLSWSQVGGNVIPAGTVLDTRTLGKYILKDDYVPVDNGDGTCSYSPSFISEDSLLDKILFSMSLQLVDSLGNETTETLYSFPYTGTVGTIASHLAQISGWAVNVGQSVASALISVRFDGDTAKSAAQKIASACGKTAIFTGHEIGIGTAEAYSPDDYYNYFVVLGGTRNMGKRTLKGGYTAVTRRLTIDDNGSIIDRSNGGQRMMKLLINDDIYPRMELQITSVSSRECYMLSESGEKIVDHYEGEGDLRIPVYKKYHKFYIEIGFEGDIPYTLDANTVIAGKPLGILFQSGLLMGREFDLAYFDPETEPVGGYVENEADDVRTYDKETWSGYSVAAGSYRIIMHADGDILLPNTTLAPHVGDKVTLTGVAMSDTYKNIARNELRAWGETMAGFYSTRKAASFQVKRDFSDCDFLIGGSSSPILATPVNSSGNTLQAGETSDYIVTSVQTDLATGGQTITYGTFKPKGLLQSMVEKLEGAQLKGGGGTVGGEDDYYRHTASVGIDQFNALRSAGGSLGMVRVNERINGATTDLGNLRDSFNEVKDQVDRKFEVWYGNGFPLPNADDPDFEQVTTPYPANEWNTDEKKALHLQDIYFDMSREPKQTGGRAWRWELVDGSYLWKKITDADTLSALEGLSDVANDGKLTGGAEKMRVYIDWVHACDEFRGLVTDSNIEALPDKTAAYISAFRTLGTILNGGADIFSVDPGEEDGSTINSFENPPAWFSGDPNDTDNIYTTTEIDDVEEYYQAWYEYYRCAAELSVAAVEHADEIAQEAKAGLEAMANDNILTVQEKSDILREWLSVASEKQSLVRRAVKARVETGAGTAYANFIEAFCMLATYLDNPSYEHGHELTESDIPSASSPEDFASFPTMLRDNHNSQINGSAFTACWNSYYDARSALMTAISAKRQSYFIGVNVPTPPYSTGDFWLKTENSGDTDGVLKLCINGKNEGQIAEESDWRDFAANVSDIRILLCALIEELYGMFGSGIVGKHIFLGCRPSSLSGSLAYENGKMWYASKGVWNAYGDSEDVAILADAFRGCYDIIGQHEIVVYGEKSNNATLYDVYVRPLTYSHSSKGPDGKTYSHELEGAIEIMMYGENGWELLMKSVNGVLENLGKWIRAIVFGSENGDIATASGMVIGQRFMELFSEAKVLDSEGNYVTLAQALFGLSVSPITDGNGNTLYFRGGEYSSDPENIRTSPTDGFSPVYTSDAKLSADKINFSGKTIDLSADQIGFIGRTVIKNENGEEKLSFDSDGNMTSQGNIVSVKDGMYSQMKNGQFEIGVLETTSQGGETVTTFNPRYRVSLVEGMPVIEMLNAQGEVIGQIDEHIFEVRTIQQVTGGENGEEPVSVEIVTKEIKDSWIQKSFIMVRVGTTTWDDIKDNIGTCYYRYTEGYVETTRGGNTTRTYTSGGGTPNENKNGRWFQSMDPAASHPQNDTYVDSLTFIEKKSEDSVFSRDYRKVYRMTSGVLYDTGDIIASPWYRRIKGDLTEDIVIEDNGLQPMEPQAGE